MWAPYCQSVLLWRFSHANTDVQGLSLHFCPGASEFNSPSHIDVFSVCWGEGKKLQWPFDKTIGMVVVCCNMLGFVCFRLMVRRSWLWPKRWTLPRQDQLKWMSWTRLSSRNCPTLLQVTWPLSMPSSGVWLHRKLWRSVYCFTILLPSVCMCAYILVCFIMTKVCVPLDSSMTCFVP